MLNYNIFIDIKYMNFIYIVLETKYTIHHIERTLYTDRGKIKWIAETKLEAFEAMDREEEARRSHIDGADLFPRLYFLPLSFMNEFAEWLKARELVVFTARHVKV